MQICIPTTLQSVGLQIASTKAVSFSLKKPIILGQNLCSIMGKLSQLDQIIICVQEPKLHGVTKSPGAGESELRLFTFTLRYLCPGLDCLIQQLV